MLSDKLRNFSLPTSYFRGARIVYFCFDSSDKTSLDDVQRYITSVAKYMQPYACILLAMKSDLPCAYSKEQMVEFLNKNKHVVWEYYQVSNATMESVAALRCMVEARINIALGQFLTSPTQMPPPQSTSYSMCHVM